MSGDRNDRAQQFLTDILRPGYAEIEDIIDIPRSDAADIMLVAIAGQEADWRHRYQVLSSGNKGPARGLWQFERGGGVHGVLRHARTAQKARDLCAVRGVVPEDRPVWEALEHDDRLAIGFARLLLWSDPRPLPTNEADAWDTYIHNWRPGKPHRNRWGGNYGPAVRAVEQVAPAPGPLPDATDPEVSMGEHNESLMIRIEHTGADGNPLSVFELAYPTMDNATANALQLSVVKSMANVIEQFARSKADALGQPWPE